MRRSYWAKGFKVHILSILSGFTMGRSLLSAFSNYSYPNNNMLLKKTSVETVGLSFGVRLHAEQQSACEEARGCKDLNINSVFNELDSYLEENHRKGNTKLLSGRQSQSCMTINIPFRALCLNQQTGNSGSHISFKPRISMT